MRFVLRVCFLKMIYILSLVIENLHNENYGHEQGDRRRQENNYRLLMQRIDNKNFIKAKEGIYK